MNSRQADIEAVVDLVAHQLNRWEESAHGDREGALELLLAVASSGSAQEILACPAQLADHLRTRLSQVR